MLTIFRSSLIKPAMLIQLLCKDVLYQACSDLSTFFKRCQIHLATVKHLFSSRYFDSNLGSFIHGISNLLCIFVFVITYAFHVKLVVKCISGGSFVSYVYIVSLYIY